MTQAAMIHWAAHTHSGSRKPRNDDSMIAFASGPEGAEILAGHGCLPLSTRDLVFAVSDGMGGGNAGDLASSTILQQMSEIIPDTFKAAAAGFFPDCLSHLSTAIRSVHERINAVASTSEDKTGMAATLALAWFTPENLYLTNVGDSRIYRSKNGILEQLTRDHSLAWGQWKRGEILETQYRRHPRRAALYEVVGGGHERINPHFAAVSYEPGDRFLICSDGLIDGLWERQIANALASCAENPAETALRLVNRAVENSGVDDTTLIIVTVTATPEVTAMTE